MHYVAFYFLKNISHMNSRLVKDLCWNRLNNSFTVNTTRLQKVMQLLMEISVSMIHKFVKTMPCQMHTLIKAKDDPTKY